MRNFRKINLWVLIALTLAGPAFSTPETELRSLYDKKQFFELRDRLADRELQKKVDVLFYQAAVANKFNRPEAAIGLLKKYLASPNAAKDKTLHREAFTLLADSYVKTYQYKNAGETYGTILSKFSTDLTERERSSFQNVKGLWSGLASVPGQRVVFKGDSSIQATQERVGRMIPVAMNGQTEPFIFDTGANLSTITESLAKKLGVDILETTFDVGSITGNLVKAKLGVAKQLGIGNVQLQNVVFIVFPDESLFIKQINYQINGIIGFPVIEALREITWTKTKELHIPARPRVISHANLALDGLTPLIAGTYQRRSLTFSFDTGASSTSLYPPFFKAFESEITANGKPYTATVTGAGGSRKVNGFNLENVTIEFAGKQSVLKKVEVLTEETTGSSRYFYGNIGRDIVDQHDRMTISFVSMGVLFE